jgi:hypothetical protein
MFKLQQDSGHPLWGPFGKKVHIDMEIELHPDGHAQKRESCHEHIARDLFHPGDPRSEEISHNDIRGDDNHLEGQKDGCQNGTDQVDDIKNPYYFHKTQVFSFARFIIQNVQFVKFFLGSFLMA